MPSDSPGRAGRVVCDTEKRRCVISASTRARSVDLPAPDGPDTTMTLGARLLNVLHLLAQALQLALEPHDLLQEGGRGDLAADGVGFAPHLLGQEIQPLAAGSVRPDRRPGLGDVAAQPLYLLGHVLPVDQ